MGRTKPRLASLKSKTDHPHARGENASDPGVHNLERGPSPRAWGEHRVLRKSNGRVRTIPTRVGRTRRTLPEWHRSADHPHARGENKHLLKYHVQRAGPSPRAWGEPPAPQADSSPPRTIPTRVGRTQPVTEASQAASDHPHARGENRAASECRSAEAGPSPRAWGEPRQKRHPAPVRRTIPTRVGRTVVPIFIFPCRPDHPHARGENSFARHSRGVFRGPSPRAWGEQPYRAS